ncbi:hypothetical protein GF360_02185 [candidate division WWE3 bacterium]|nr:hypothetical protein [candidate division WWE3 bacterium]
MKMNPPKKIQKQTDQKISKKTKNKLEAKILRFLSYKSRTVSETREAGHKYLRNYKSLSKAEKEQLINEILEPLKEAGYLDDVDYAASYIREQKQRSLPRGPYYIFSFLRTKGLERDLIQKSLEENYSDEDQEKCIRNLIRKKNDKPKDKLIAYLLRRGFSKHLVYRLVDSNHKNH